MKLFSYTLLICALFANPIDDDTPKDSCIHGETVCSKNDPSGYYACQAGVWEKNKCWKDNWTCIVKMPVTPRLVICH